MAYATLADYEARHGSVCSAEQINKITALLDDASALIQSILPVGYTPAQELTRAVTVAMVARGSTNTGGLRSKTVGNVSEAYAEQAGLYLTEGEERMLLAAYDADHSSAYTVDARDDGLPLRRRSSCRR
ncbi:hypothetical protein E1286_05180 [Nonomuraea terrae]|uniref:Uncharacterized protein n=1 Tax=Nonomuraea terrae TaxID=2530383 RepID=A0A4R4ZB42_9ACTN|nr:hypothetical protein [Nonomuraea terrae]TDD54584.1 hypothetical protein E1286_05180 [Nonomuraea terrae]